MSNRDKRNLEIMLMKFSSALLDAADVEHELVEMKPSKAEAEEYDAVEEVRLKIELVDADSSDERLIAVQKEINMNVKKIAKYLGDRFGKDGRVRVRKAQGEKTQGSAVLDFAGQPPIPTYESSEGDSDQ